MKMAAGPWITPHGFSLCWAVEIISSDWYLFIAAYHPLGP
jgi:hypothetical protein